MPNKESANELFHFTNKYDSIKSILNDKFKPFFCVEDISYMYEKKSNMIFAYPMVCFCDIPLGRIALHKYNYGDYGVGLTKDWGIKNNFTIVNYSFPESLKSVSFRLLVNYYSEKCIGLNHEDSSKFKNSLNLLLMTSKPYEGKVFYKTNRSWSENKIRFYNEREWRFIPLVDGLNWSFALDQFSGDCDAFFNAIEEEQQKIQKRYKLDFTVDDITHVFLKDDSEKEKLLNDISTSYNVKELKKIEKLICINKVER